MKLTFLENEDLREIIFENRNKAYGAYQIRREYYSTLCRSLLITLSVACSFTMLLIFTQKIISKKFLPDVTRHETHEFRNIEVVQEQIKIESKTEIVPLKQKTTLENNYRVVDVVKPVETTLTTTMQTESTTGKENGALAMNTNTSNPVNPNVVIETQPAVESASVDILPEFPGGLEKFYKYLLNRLQFTPEARGNLSGRYFVTFIIGTDGQVSSVKMMKTIGYGMDEKVTKILVESPEWKPGSLHGQPVSVIFRLPVNFQMLQ